MKNEQLYKETVDIILDAYNDRRLVHGHPCGCFIGNIVAARGKVIGLPKIEQFDGDGEIEVEDWEYRPDWWYEIVAPIKRPGTPWHIWNKGGSNEEGLRQIQLTGYTPTEILSLEAAFESAGSSDTDGMQGMRNALEILAEIHETKADESIQRLEKIYEEREVKLESCPSE